MREKHKDACKEESDQRKVKVKEERKVRKEAEKTRVEEQSALVLNDIDDAVNRTGSSNHVRKALKKTTMEAVKEYANAKM